MRLRGNIELHLNTDRRWYVVEEQRVDPDDRRIICRPEGYPSHCEARRWRTLYRAIRELQERRTPGKDGFCT